MNRILCLPGLFLVLGCACGPKAPAPDKNPPVETLAFSVKTETLCDDEKGIFPDPEKLARYVNYVSYDTVQTVTGDSAVVSFEFIADCCLAFTGEATRLDDNLRLSYRVAENSPAACDCRCDYRMRFTLAKPEKMWQKVQIIGPRDRIHKRRK